MGLRKNSKSDKSAGREFSVRTHVYLINSRQKPYFYEPL
jgi:hypothetical protein